MMKKILAMAAAAMMTATGAQAQGYDYETKHEVAVSIGTWSNSEILDVFEEEKYDSNNGSNDYDDSAVHFNWHVSLIGIEAGSLAIRGFAELGIGEQGILQAGVRYKF